MAMCLRNQAYYGFFSNKDSTAEVVTANIKNIVVAKTCKIGFEPESFLTITHLPIEHKSYHILKSFERFLNFRPEGADSIACFFSSIGRVLKITKCHICRSLVNTLHNVETFGLPSLYRHTRVGRS